MAEMERNCIGNARIKRNERTHRHTSLHSFKLSDHGSCATCMFKERGSLQEAKSAEQKVNASDISCTAATQSKQTDMVIVCVRCLESAPRTNEIYNIENSDGMVGDACE